MVRRGSNSETMVASVAVSSQGAIEFTQNAATEQVKTEQVKDSMIRSRSDSETMAAASVAVSSQGATTQIGSSMDVDFQKKAEVTMGNAPMQDQDSLEDNGFEHDIYKKAIEAAEAAEKVGDKDAHDPELLLEGDADVEDGKCGTYTHKPICQAKCKCEWRDDTGTCVYSRKKRRKRKKKNRKGCGSQQNGGFR